MYSLKLLTLNTRVGFPATDVVIRDCVEKCESLTTTLRGNPLKNYNLKNAIMQRGMTLIELSVVLLILVGLAGLLLPYVTGFTEKTQTSSAADSLAEINKAIDRFETQFIAYPDGFDSLVAGAEGTAVIDWLVGVGNVPAVPADLEVFAMTSGPVKSLKAAEIDSLYPMQNTGVAGTDFNATFAGTSTKATISDAAIGGSTTKAVRIKPASLTTLIQNNMGIEVDSDDLVALNAENDYVVFGVGQHTQMTGKVLKEAPVYFSGGVDNPTARYARFLAVFKVPRDGTRASFVGAMTPDLKTQSLLAQTFHEGIKDDD